MTKLLLKGFLEFTILTEGNLKSVLCESCLKFLDDILKDPLPVDINNLIDNHIREVHNDIHN